MDCSPFSKYSWLDFLFSVIGVCAYVFDVGSDMWVAKEFYCHGEFIWFGVLVGLMVLSSVVIQMFSWFWFKYDRDLENFEVKTAPEKFLFCGQRRVKVSCCLHVLQLGFFFRHLTAIWQGFRVWWRGQQGSEYAVYLVHDLSMLRLIETFCESAPQLTLMAYIMLFTNQARTIQCVSVVASTTSIAWMVVDYHRSLRSFLPDKAKQAWASSVIYFLWNLLLIAPRVACVALFTSVLSHYIALHFLLVWPTLVLWAWRQGTDFMDSPAGERLYRATVGLIWYFSWFNVAEGSTRVRSIIYHSFMIADGAILLVTWWYYRDTELTQSYAIIMVLAIPVCYTLGLLLKTLYYCYFHPKLWRPQDKRGGKLEPDGSMSVSCMAMSTQTDTPSEPHNKRMARHARIFYTAGVDTSEMGQINRREGKT
ncbi:XK-related protein 8.3 [Alosa sapidissima]|uniref:XK-related protein 8.3 n=1 Tax=Alosa sapidissima TaxID=34773 RepID=UPI001C09D50C|nr:XK-related protein 8.3 [Alosa sapidissima]